MISWFSFPKERRYSKIITGKTGEKVNKKTRPKAGYIRYIN
jgi:hypothetical protein